jgi:hypothetical protein
MKTRRKGLEEEIVEGFDWSDRLDIGDTIVDSIWTIDAGLTGQNATFDQASTEIELTLGTLDTQYKCQNRITTGNGEVYERSIKIMVVER